MQFSPVFQSYRDGKFTYPCFPAVLLTSTSHNILSKPLAASQHNHCRNNGQRRERNESCRSDYHQSLERILAEPGIEPAISCSQVCNTTGGAVGLGDGCRRRGHYLSLYMYFPFFFFFSQTTGPIEILGENFIKKRNLCTLI